MYTYLSTPPPGHPTYSKEAKNHGLGSRTVGVSGESKSELLGVRKIPTRLIERAESTRAGVSREATVLTRIDLECTHHTPPHLTWRDPMLRRNGKTAVTIQEPPRRFFVVIWRQIDPLM